jgi:hypothetical protein
MLHVVFQKVLLETVVFGLLTDQGVLRVRNGALDVLLNGGCSGDGFVEDLPNKLAKVESLLGGVWCIVVLCLANGLGNACVLFVLVANMAAAEGKQAPRPGLARDAIVGPIRIREANKLEAVVQAPPPNVKRKSMVPWR